jgi:hypothetical protein
LTGSSSHANRKEKEGHGDEYTTLYGRRTEAEPGEELQFKSISC